MPRTATLEPRGTQDAQGRRIWLARWESYGQPRAQVFLSTEDGIRAGFARAGILVTVLGELAACAEHLSAAQDCFETEKAMYPAGAGSRS